MQSKNLAPTLFLSTLIGCGGTVARTLAWLGLRNAKGAVRAIV